MPDDLATVNRARPSDRPDIPALTGLRFYAAFFVLIAHGCAAILADHETPDGAIYWVRQASGFGMTLFFVLSGFVIHYNYAHLVTAAGIRGVASYLWARFARLYPLFLLMMVVYLLVSSRHLDYWTGHPERLNSTLQALPYFLLSVQSWLYLVIDGNPLLDAIGGASPITWSISTEWFFYFFYLALVWLVLKLRRPLVTFIFLSLWCVLFTAGATALYNRTDPINAWALAHFGPVADAGERPQDSFVRWLLYFSPYLRLGEFVLGSLVAELYVQMRRNKVGALENLAGAAGFVAAVASVVWFTYAEYSPNIGMTVLREMNMNFALAPSAAVIIFCAARYRGAMFGLLTFRPVMILGEASYSIYLVHLVILTAAARLLAPAGHGIWYALVELLLIVLFVFVVSTALYAYYEAPARRLLRGFLAQPPAAGTAGGAGSASVILSPSGPVRSFSGPQSGR
jgi:peptidoglycan/LPS O-acetylase OafA/YrhL